MTFEIILSVALKVLGCAVVIYFIAGFLVSCTRLLPILSILSSVGTILSVSILRGDNNKSLIWLPIALSVLTQLFYKGEGFMNPKIHENVYQLVSVERKWNSIFEEFDDYELHFSPLETGGFVENTVLNALFFGFYYHFLMFRPDSWVVYIFPIYIIGMSIIDLLMVFGKFNISQFFYGAIRILILMIAIAIGFLGPFGGGNKDIKSDKMYKACSELAVFDSTVSYKMDYELLYLSDYKYKNYDETYFVYDSDLNAGAEYEQKTWGRMYNKIFIKNSNFGDDVVRLNNVSGKDAEFKYICKAEEVGGPFKYFNVTSTSDFMQYYMLDRHKFDHSSINVFNNDDGDTLKIIYSTRDDSTYDSENNINYSVVWVFNVDEQRNPVSLDHIECKIYINSTNMERWFYSPLTDGTGLEELFDDNGLKGYTYKENEICGVDMKALFDSLNGTLNDFDLMISEEYEGNNNFYLYDCETKMTALYVNRADDAMSVYGDNIAEYKPDFYISDSDFALYDSEYALIADTAPSEFLPFTFNNATASNAIINSFAVPFSKDNCEVYINYENANILIMQKNEALDSDMEYHVMVEVKENSICRLNVALVFFTYEGREYKVYAYAASDNYDIPAPASSE